jgi:hypothetical protein
MKSRMFLWGLSCAAYLVSAISRNLGARPQLPPTGFVAVILHPLNAAYVRTLSLTAEIVQLQPSRGHVWVSLELKLDGIRSVQNLEA